MRVNLGNQDDNPDWKALHSGLFTKREQRLFLLFQIIAPICFVLICSAAMSQIGNPLLTGLAMIVGIILGFAIPIIWVDCVTKSRKEKAEK